MNSPVIVMVKVSHLYENVKNRPHIKKKIDGVRK